MIRKRKRGSGYAFQGRVNKKGMVEITRTFTTRKDAERWEREQQIAIEQCALQHKPMNLASKTLRQLIEKYRVTHLPFKRGCLTEQSVLDYLCRTESFVDAPLSTLSPEIFTSYMNRRTKGENKVKTSTFARQFQILHHIFENHNLEKLSLNILQWN